MIEKFTVGLNFAWCLVTGKHPDECQHCAERAKESRTFGVITSIDRESGRITIGDA